jgi:hypothetical protein
MSESCGCCEGITVAVPASEVNPPGLFDISYRVGTQATFLETMLARLTGLTLEAPSASGAGVDTIMPLARLTTRDPSDPSIALLDGWACIADVLSFYQERIANEGYLPTATQHRSLLELATLIGYRARPGVSASVKLAFTVSSGFQGVIPAGTRAQSIPASGQNPQFFETSADLTARDSWNALAPRLQRPSLITAPASDASGEPVVTGADVIDTVYFDGISTNLKAGDALLFMFGAGADPVLRFVAVVTPQPNDKRTSVTLAPNAAGLDLQLIVNQAALFPGSDIAAAVVTVLATVIANMQAAGTRAIVANLARGAIPPVQRQQSIAAARGFDRLTAWIDQALRLLAQTARTGSLPFTAAARTVGISARGEQLAALPAPPPAAPLAQLHEIVAPLATAPSVQPANPLRLMRTVTQSFAAQSDTAPRLLAALNPSAAPVLYQGWQAVARPSGQVEVLAARVKAALFASTWVGPPTSISSFDDKANQTTITTSYAPPSISSAWHATSGGKFTPPWVALDAVYDQIEPGSWVAIQRPEIDQNGDPTGKTLTSFHLVTGLRSVTMDTGGGFAAKVTQLVITPEFLSDEHLARLAIEKPVVLRRTVVYAQTENVALTEEPLDVDVEGASLDLDQVYDGLEAGRWVIVSGSRTDIPGISGVTASELAMVSAVAQGAQPLLCAAFPLAAPPFASVAYTTESNAAGDRLVVGTLANPDLVTDPNGNQSVLRTLPLPSNYNQQYCEQVDLGGGVYASPYVPTANERAGLFPDFEGLLIDPSSNLPFPSGTIPQASLKGGLFAWRVGSEKLHTILSLAAPLAYAYDRTNVTIYGNVIDATHGQSVGEILGNGNAAQAFQQFALRQSPLTYVSANTPSGIASTLSVQVNELLWHETDDLAAAAAGQRIFVTSEDDTQKTTITFGDGVHGALLPTGTANIKATYRYGLGIAGNVATGQISQLTTHPLGAQGVINPLPATGGADPDSTDQVRANAPVAVMALDRLVSVSDYAAFSRNYAGIGKAVAVAISAGRRRLVYVTIAGAGDIPIDPTSDLYRNLVLSLQTYGDPSLPVSVGIRRVRLLVISASIGLQADFVWEDVAPQVTAALQSLFAFDSRALGQPAFASEAILAAQQVEGVAFVNLTTFDGVPENITAAGLAGLGKTLRLRQVVEAEAAHVNLKAAPGAADRILPAELVFLTPDIPATLTLMQAAT